MGTQTNFEIVGHLVVYCKMKSHWVIVGWQQAQKVDYFMMVHTALKSNIETLWNFPILTHICKCLLNLRFMNSQKLLCSKCRETINRLRLRLEFLSYLYSLLLRRVGMGNNAPDGGFVYPPSEPNDRIDNLWMFQFFLPPPNKQTNKQNTQNIIKQNTQNSIPSLPLTMKQILANPLNILHLPEEFRWHCHQVCIHLFVLLNKIFKWHRCYARTPILNFLFLNINISLSRLRVAQKILICPLEKTWWLLGSILKDNRDWWIHIVNVELMRWRETIQ